MWKEGALWLHSCWSVSYGLDQTGRKLEIIQETLFSATGALVDNIASSSVDNPVRGEYLLDGYPLSLWREEVVFRLRDFILHGISREVYEQTHY